jgi:hypothetical protein
MILFGEGSPESAEVAIPSADAPNNFIAALWDDLVVDNSGRILYTTVGAAPNRKLIIQFTNMGFYPYPVFMGTFIVILHETTNKIQVQYRIIIDATSARAHGGSATIGIENATGSTGVQHAYHDPAAIATGKAISFTPSGLTYTLDANAIYDGVVLTTNLTLPDPGIPQLLSPPQDAVIGDDYTFQWAEAGNSASYTLLLSHFPDIGGATSYEAGTNLSRNVSGLTLDTVYYWGVFATNATGTTWCEIKRFATSSAAPLEAVPQTAWVEENQDKTITLNYTGGDASPKNAVITSVPASGSLYQYNAGAKGAKITLTPATVTDPGRNVIYSADGGSGNNAGNFNFRIHDGSGDSPVALVTVNVSPPGIPNLMYTARNTGIEMQFDIPMANPSGRESQFTVNVNGSPVAVTSLALKEGDPFTIAASLATPLAGSETVTIAYTAGNVTSAQGGWLLSFTDQAVTLLAQDITFNPLTPKEYGNPPFTVSATASSGLPMTFSSSNLAVATIIGNTVTITGVGSSEITARQAGNETYAPARYPRTLTVSETLYKTLNISLLLEGFFNGTGGMIKVQQSTDGESSFNMFPGATTDTLTVKLANASEPYSTVFSAKGVPVNTSGNISISSVPSSLTGNYYIIIDHRNHIETWSQVVSFAGATINYNFTDNASKAWGNNLIHLGSYYCIYAGDVNNDEYVDGFDIVTVFNLNKKGGYGYQLSDVNGDGFVDGFDLVKVFNNNKKGVGMITPLSPM